MFFSLLCLLCLFVVKWLVARAARQQRIALQCLRAVLIAHRKRATLIHRDAGVLTFRIENVKSDAEAWQAATVQQPLLDCVVLDTVQHFHASVLRMSAASHLL